MFFVFIKFLFLPTALLYAGYAMDNLGRKWTLAACFVPRLLMGLFVIFANDVWMLYVGRIFAGQADMTLIAVVSAYSSEASGVSKLLLFYSTSDKAVFK